MMKFISKYKIALGLLVIILLGFWAYSSFIDTEEVAVLFEERQEPVGEELFEVLAVLRGIQLDGDIFSDPDFLTLQDFETAVSAGRAGRANPFAPAGADAGGVIVEPTYQVVPIAPAESFVAPTPQEDTDPATTTPEAS
jgi:hypothetical protein